MHNITWVPQLLIIRRLYVEESFHIFRGIKFVQTVNNTKHKSHSSINSNIIVRFPLGAFIIINIINIANICTANSSSSYYVCTASCRNKNQSIYLFVCGGSIYNTQRIGLWEFFLLCAYPIKFIRKYVFQSTILKNMFTIKIKYRWNETIPINLRFIGLRYKPIAATAITAILLVTVINKIQTGKQSKQQPTKIIKFIKKK